jgi:hypothetical protein
MNKPHDQSVTSVPCECGWLRRQACDSQSPVVFDESSGAYCDHMSVSLEQQIGDSIVQMFVPKPLKNHS